MVSEVGGSLIELEVTPDHVHLLELVDTVVESTVGGAPSEVVRCYVENGSWRGR